MRSSMPLARLLVLAVLLLPTTVRAQVEQRSLRLNTPALGSQYLDITNETTLEGNAAYTIEAWVYPTSYAGFPTIVGNDYHVSYWLGLNTTGQVRYYPKDGTGIIESSAIVPLNAWTHVAATYNGTTETIYLNGSLAASSSTITGAAGTSPAAHVFIGADREGGPSYFWQGYLDEVRIWSTARTAAEIAETMYTGACGLGLPLPHYAGLVGTWDMQNSAVGFIFDRAPGGSDNGGNEINGADVDPQAPPVSYNIGLELDGVDDYVSAPLADGFSGGLTIEAWIAPYSYPPNACIAGRDFQSSFYLGLDNVGHVRFYPTGGIGNFVATTGTVPTGVWSHVAATYRSGDTRIYINGVLALQSSAITVPVGDNGAAVYIGADRSGPATPNYFFSGILDNVSITRGPLTGVQIRAAMFRQGIFGLSVMVPDAFGDLRERLNWHMDPFTVGTMNGGTSARFVRSGAAIAQQLISDVASAGIQGYHWSRLVIPYPLPDGVGGASSVGTDLPVAESAPITSVRVFVCAATSNLSLLHLTLRSPALTTIDLVDPGAGAGRDLHTVFDDGASLPLFLGVSPYPDKIQPSSALSAFNGQLSNGNWRLSASMSGSESIALWSWGLQFNGAVLGAGGRAMSHTVELSNAGANPVAGTGAVTFDLPFDADLDLAVYDLAGRRARSLLHESRGAGHYVMGWNAAGLNAGVYFLRLSVDGRTTSLKVVIAP